MEGLTLEECRGYLKKLQDICLCRVCQGPLRSPDIVVCIRGHAICTECKPRVPNCAVCRGSYCKENPITLCQMVEAIPRACRFNYGCKSILRDAADDHESWCQFRHLQCLYCKTFVECHSLLNHVYDAHKYKPHNLWECDFQRCNFQCNVGLNINVGVLKIYDGNIFNIHYVYSQPERKILVYVTFWPTKSVENNLFAFHSKFVSNDGKYTINIRREVKMKANTTTLICSICDPTLEGFNGKDVRFRTMIVDPEILEIKAEPPQSVTVDLSTPTTTSPPPPKRPKV